MARRPELTAAAKCLVSAVKGASASLRTETTGNGASALAAAATGRFDIAVDECLSAIVSLAAEKQRGGEPLENALSLQEQGSLRTAFELIIVWGLMPLLLPGVGVPLSKRSKSASTLLQSPSRPLSPLTLTRLQSIATLLISIFVDPDLCLFFAAHYLGDLVASLMQLAYLPATEPLLLGAPLDEVISRETRERFAQDLARVLETYVRCTPKVWVVCIWSCAFVVGSLTFHSVPAPLSIESLLLLSGRSATHAPVWLRQRCFGMLSTILQRPGAVPALIAQLFDGLDPTRAN